MPYASNADLPDYVKKLPGDKQSQWRAVFNSCMESDGGSDEKCFREANSVVKKDTDATEPVEPTVTAEPAETPPVTVEDASKLKRAEMDASSFAYVDASGGRHLPINDRAHVRNALARFNQTKFESAAARRTARRKIMAAARKFGIEVGTGSEKSALSMLKEWLGLEENIDYDGKPDLSVVTEDSFYTVKQADGRTRWYGRYSNAWLDRDGEILTEEAHKDYMRWAYDNGTLPELWLWHAPGTRIGETDWMDFSQGFAHASGLIDDGKESVIGSFKSQDLGMSHGFLALQQGKWVRRYRSYELSVLPRERAAVETSGFNILDAAKETEVMAFSDERRAWLVQALGEDTVKTLEADTTKMATQLKDLGVEYKEAEKKADEDTNVTVDGQKAIVAQMADLTTAMTQLVTAVGSIKKDVDAVKTAQTKTDDEKVEDAFLSKVAKAFGQNGGVTRPTESTKNVTDTGTGTPTTPGQGQADFFSQMIGEQLGVFAQAAEKGGTVGAPAVGTVTVTGSDGVQEVRD